MAELGEGDKVFGGTFNKSGVIEVKVTKLLADMTISKMAKLVEEAEGKKAPISRVADKWASIIVPTAIALAILVGIIAFYAFKVSVLLLLQHLLLLPQDWVIPLKTVCL